MTSPFLNEKIFIYNVGETIAEIKEVIKEEEDLVDNKEVIQDFIVWAARKAFLDMTGIYPRDFINSLECESIYGRHKRIIDKLVFSAIQEIGIFSRSYDLQINIVLTHERLYIITF